ncbi:MAG: hypothetical protein ACFE9Z_01780 [Promethearchaeota archaeon]
MLKYNINNYIDLRLEDGKTYIYVKNQLFLHCKYILINVYSDRKEYFEDIDSIDDALERKDLAYQNFEKKERKISPEMIFWAHCSNLQVWFEHDYDTRLIHSNIAFPLLRKLTEVGDSLAVKVFKEEIAKRLESKSLNLIRYLLFEGYLDYLNKEEIDIVLKLTRDSLTQLIVRKLSELKIYTTENFFKIKEILDLILFVDLKYNQKLIFSIFSKLPQKYRKSFARYFILHLNYKEFKEYKIPYGRFFVFFEEILNFIYINYPEIKEFLKIIDSGFFSGASSLDDKFSYGTLTDHNFI